MRLPVTCWCVVSVQLPHTPNYPHAASKAVIMGTFMLLSALVFLSPLLIESPCICEHLPPKPKLIGHRGAPMVRKISQFCLLVCISFLNEILIIGIIFSINYMIDIDSQSVWFCSFSSFICLICVVVINGPQLMRLPLARPGEHNDVVQQECSVWCVCLWDRCFHQVGPSGETWVSNQRPGNVGGEQTPEPAGHLANWHCSTSYARANMLVRPARMEFPSLCMMKASVEQLTFRRSSLVRLITAAASPGRS